MKFSESWLRTMVDPVLPSGPLAAALTMAGLEVEALEPAGPAFSGVVVGEIRSADKHPDADRLRVCEVDTGSGALLQIVCGAPNARSGLRVPCALVGAKLPAITIGKARMRGVESFGMLCSEKDLGLAQESSGLLELAPDAEIGADIRTLLALDDRLFTLKLTPNRSDCLSVAGIAREVAAITGAPLSLPSVAAAPVTLQRKLGVTLASPGGCPRYCGRVIELAHPGAPTPDWMRQRLMRSGLRPISAVVDVTNYIMLETGQPLHAFDADALSGDIVVRWARSGERLRLLNDQEIELAPDLLAITDGSGPVALAGVMGGAGTAVGDATRSIFLESAFFSPAAIAGRARRLSLNSDAAYRFERGVDFLNTSNVLERATTLVLAICGGAAGPVTEAVAAPPARPPVAVRAARVSRILGMTVSTEAIAQIFTRLGFAWSRDGDAFQVTPPSFRFDLALEADFIEEVARLHGYDRIPATAPQAALNLLPASEHTRARAGLSARLVSRDYQEVITYSFVDAALEQELGLEGATCVALRNPIASHMGVMRTSLLPGLIGSLRFNLNRRQDRVRLFELGRCFSRDGDGYRQPDRLGGLAYGPVAPEQWGVQPARPVDFYDVKADVAALVPDIALQFKAQPYPALHPGRSAAISSGGEHLGWLGELHPGLVQKYELPAAPVVFELDLGVLIRARLPAFAELSKFPPVRRDMAVLVGNGIPVQSLLDALQTSKPEFVTDIDVFDLYRGPGVAESQKSLAFRVVMQDTAQTLTDEQIESAMSQLTAVLVSRFGAELRR